MQERADLLYSPLIYTVDDADTKKALIDFYTSQADLKNKNALLLESIPAIEKVKSGPQLDIDIRPIEPSSWSFAAWSQRKDFSNYYFEGEELKYRGLTLRSGDFILVNENSSADGLYTSINTPQSYFSHFGMLVFIKQDGNIFPAVFENHKKGVRAVPLSIFISEKFTSYAEIYRLPNQSADWADRLSDVALQVLQEVHAYDFTSQEKDRKYLNCANVGSLFLEKLSVKPIESKSTYLPKAFANMEILGMQPNIRMLSPTDYMKDPRVQFVGVVDNNLLPKLLADRLVENRFVELVSSKRLNPANFPFMYHLNMWGLQHIEDKDALGSLFLSYSGLTAETFPKGPNSLMAIIEVLEDEVNTASLQTLKDLGSLDTNDFSLKALESDEKSRAKIEAQLKDLESWFD